MNGGREDEDIYIYIYIYIYRERERERESIHILMIDHDQVSAPCVDVLQDLFSLIFIQWLVLGDPDTILSSFCGVLWLQNSVSISC
jgi:hypothetical protein